MKTILYSRVSRDDLNCENQERILKEWAKTNNLIENVDYKYIWEEQTSRKTRPLKDLILQKLREGEYKTVVIVRIDRWARSLQELISDVNQIVNAGGRFVSISNGFDFRKDKFNSGDQLMLNNFGAFAQFEREMIRERTLEGLSRVKAQGKKLGRPFKNK